MMDAVRTESQPGGMNMTGTLLRSLVWWAGFCFFPATLLAQVLSGQGADSLQSRDAGSRTHKVVAGQVTTPSGDPVARAGVEISNDVGAPYQFLVTDSHGIFRADYDMLNGDEALHATATLRITKKGFQVAHKIAEMRESSTNAGVLITLRRLQPDDPNLLSQADLIKGVAPRLRQLGPADGLSAKQAKDYARGVQDFLDRNHLNDAVPRLAQVANLNPPCLKCRTMLSLAELSWGDWDDARADLGQSVNALIKNPKLGSAEPLLVYGVLLSWQHEPDKASAFFREALKYAPQEALALQELGRVESMSMNWWDANESLKKALDAGAGPEARLMHAEALLWVGTINDAMSELNIYLAGRNPKTMPPRVRSLWETIHSGMKDQSRSDTTKARAHVRGEEPLDYLHHPPRNLPDFQPAPDQAQLSSILAAVGKNVSQFLANLPSICSVEKVQQERLHRNGKTVATQEHTYRYLVTAPEQNAGPTVEEYRGDPKGTLTSQTGLDADHMLTEGFVSAPLVFHPAYQSGCSFRLLGSQKVKGRRTYVIVYAQDPAKSRMWATFQNGSTEKRTYTQGVAWIDAETYQIIRITSDLLAPLPEVRLDKEATDIQFSEVHFQRMTQSFWLPQAVTVTVDWNGKHLRNTHAYSDFLLTNVNSTQKIGRPQGAEEALEPPVDPTPDDNRSRQAPSPVPVAKKR